MSSELSDAPDTSYTADLPNSPVKPARLSWSPLDFILLSLLLVLAFLLGAFRATNNDLYFHFAVGRLLSQGEYTFGVDPFSFTTEGQYWANHAWLYAWSIYGWFQALGGAGVVAFHAGLIVIMALLLWFARPKDASWLTTTEVLGLCVLVASLRFGVHPATPSLVFFAGLIAILFRAGVLGEHPAPLVKRLWLLPPIFALWANVDVGFMFGLLLLGLCLTVPSPHRALLGRVTLASILACCLNPHHVHVFALPPELSYILVALQIDFLPASWVDAGRTLHVLNVPAHYLLHSPLSSLYLNVSGHSCAGLFYFLVLVGYLSSQAAVVVLTRRTGRSASWTNVVVGGVFALLSLMLARLIPWFALLAGPLFLSNLSLLARMRPMPAPGLPVLLKIVAMFFFAIGITLAIPGWLHSSKWDAFAPRRVAFAIHENQPLRRLAERLSAEKPSRVLSLNLDLPAYLAYFGPGTRSFMDTRFELFAKQSTTFREIRKSLDDDAKKWTDHSYWEEEVEARKIDVIAFTDGFSRGGEAAPLLTRFWSRSEDWPMLYGDGAALAFGRNSRGPDLRDVWAQRAFGPRLAQNDPVPVREPRPTTLSDVYWGRVSQLRESTAEPLLLDEYYVLYRGRVHLALEKSVGLQSVGIGIQGLTAGPIAGLGHAMAIGRGFFNAYPLPAAPMLAVQESQRLAKISPSPFPIHLGPEPNMVLARSYELLFRTVEAPWMEYRPGAGFTSGLQNWRRFQIAAAANRAQIQALESYSPPTTENVLQILTPRDTLRDVMREYRYFDADSHLLESMILHATQIQEGSPQKSARVQRFIDQWEIEKRRLEPEFKKRSEDYAVSVADFKLETPENQFERHQRAEYFGLGYRSLENLEKIALSKKLLQEKPFFCGRVMLSTMEQYLRFGRPTDVLRMMQENREAAEFAKRMGPLHYYYLLMFAESCRGDQESAEQVLKQQIEQPFPGKAEFHNFSRREVGAFAVKTQLDLASTLLAGGIPIIGLHDLHRAGIVMQDVNIVPEVRMFRGLIALEQGKTKEALRHFEAALDLDWPGNYFPERGVIRNYRDLLKKHQAK